MAGPLVPGSGSIFTIAASSVDLTNGGLVPTSLGQKARQFMLYSGSVAYPYASRCVTTAALVGHCNRHLEMVISGRKSCKYSTTYSFATLGVNNNAKYGLKQ
jgi:hypothetical protein